MSHDNHITHVENQHMHHGNPDHSKHQTSGHNHHQGMALSATLHCLTGCAIGELLGMIIGVSLGLTALTTITLSISLAFVFGYLLSMIPLLKNGIALKRALKLVLIADTLSIASMEIAENLIMLVIPGAMDSGLANPLFWASMTVAFLVGFAVAYPVNKMLLNRGKGHAITHEATVHHDMNNKPLVFGLVAFYAWRISCFLVWVNLSPLYDEEESGFPDYRSQGIHFTCYLCSGVKFSFFSQPKG